MSDESNVVDNGSAPPLPLMKLDFRSLHLIRNDVPLQPTSNVAVPLPAPINFNPASESVSMRTRESTSPASVSLPAPLGSVLSVPKDSNYMNLVDLEEDALKPDSSPGYEAASFSPVSFVGIPDLEPLSDLTSNYIPLRE